MTDENRSHGTPEELPPSLSASERIERICERFEGLWRAGQRPSLRALLATAQTLGRESRHHLLVQLIAADLKWRWAQLPELSIPFTPDMATGDAMPIRPRLDDYVAMHPELGRLEDLPSQLIAAEYRARRLAGERIDRETFLQRFPERDRELVRELTWLDDLLEQELPIPPAEPADGADAAQESTIRYRKVREVAAGGCGRVSLARDTEIDRRVALKEIKPEYADVPEYRARFLLEAEVSGRLEHPGIVPVYGLGHYPDGRPYYAMRYVRGESLNAAIQRFHATPPSQPWVGERLLEFHKLLRRFLDVCNAVQYAHMRGVLHRDLKPANVMLGRYGETLVIDWGLAKLLQTEPSEPDLEESFLKPPTGRDSGMSPSTGTVGTLGFMSPEQAAADLDRLGKPSDVYSLGAILYCVLTGQPTITQVSKREALERIKRGQFPRPRERHPQVPRPLEGVCLKALALAPEDRYASPHELAAEIENWLADEPVTAYQEHVREKLARWIRRHYTWVVAGAISLLLVAVISVTAALIVADALKRESAARQEAVRQYRIARKATDRFLTGASEALKYYPRTGPVRQAFLTNAAEAYEQLIKHGSGDLEFELERGRGFLRLSEVYQELDDAASATKTNDRAEELFRKLLVIHPNSQDCRMELANCHTSRGLLYRDEGQVAAADASYQAAITELEPLVQQSPQAFLLVQALMTALINRGELLTLNGSLAEAKRTLVRALALPSPPPDPAMHLPPHELALARARLALSRVLCAEGRYDEAAEQAQQAIDTASALSAGQPDDPEYRDARAAAAVYLGHVQRLQAHPQQEAAAYRQAAGDYQALCMAKPDSTQFRQDLVRTELNLAILFDHCGETERAEQALQEAVAVVGDPAAGGPHAVLDEDLLAFLQALHAKLLRERGSFEKAKAELEGSIKILNELIRQASETSNHPLLDWRHKLAYCHRQLALTLQLMGDREAADRHFRQALDRLTGLPEPTPDTLDELARICQQHGELLYAWDQPEPAREAFAKARQYWREIERFGPVAADYRHHLAEFLLLCPDPAARDVETALKIARELTEADAADNPACWSTRGIACYRCGDWQGASEAFEQAVHLGPAAHGRIWFFQAMTRWQRKEAKEAQEDLARGVAWMEKQRPYDLRLQRIRHEAEQLLGTPPPR